MMDRDPLTDLSRRRLIDLARQVVAAHPAHYGAAPLPYVALQLREFQKFCEDAGITDPADTERILLAVFRPAPQALSSAQTEYVMHLITADDANPARRALAVSRYLAPEGG
ncbi:hypothetical protein [Tabrizicola aquatica]|jgi:hypothetical protein|uniref:hypothetical protein n=1 Tax=Tabrizicola aquatica TaxID=909926 RepID=UPI000CD184CE|nr:hypothetical protein [Tabrizicola aquatica]